MKRMSEMRSVKYGGGFKREDAAGVVFLIAIVLNVFGVVLWILGFY
jgi:hypothetical protein